MSSRLKIGVLGCIVALLCYGSAVAQDGADGVDPDRMLAEFDEDNGNGILDEDIDALTLDEMSERGDSKLSAMQVTLESVSELLEQARDEDRDILKINCINENLASIKGFVNVGEQSYDSLGESVDAGDADAARHHYTLISIAGQRVTGLGEQARVCAGEELRYAEDAVLEVNIDPEIGDPDEDFMDREDVLDRLPKKTPYQ